MRNYKNYQVWMKSHQLVLDIYRLAKNLPKDELFGLTNQIKRSSSSIPTNIAEGCGRNSDRDFCRFLYISYGSSNELEYQMILCKDLNFINEDEYTQIQIKIEEVKKMLNKLISTLEAAS